MIRKYNSIISLEYELSLNANIKTKSCYDFTLIPCNNILNIKLTRSPGGVIESNIFQQSFLRSSLEVPCIDE